MCVCEVFGSANIKALMQTAFITVQDVFELSPILALVSSFPPKHMLICKTSFLNDLIGYNYL